MGRRAVVVGAVLAFWLAAAACSSTQGVASLSPALEAGVGAESASPTVDAAPDMVEAAIDAGPRPKRIYLFQSSFAGANSVQSAVVRADGTLGSWEVERAPPTPPHLVLSPIAFGSVLLVVGGYGGIAVEAGRGRSKDVWRATLDATGRITTWTLVGALPSGRAEATVVTDGKSIHVMGGVDSEEGQPLATTFVSVPPPNADVVAFTETAPMSSARRGAHGVRVGDKVLTIGGFTQPGVHGTGFNFGTGSVDMAHVSPAGSILSWTPSSLPGENPHGLVAVAADSQLVFVFGHGGEGAAAVLVADVGPDGLSPWREAGRATSHMGWLGACAVAVDRKLYVFGGSATVGAGMFVPNAGSRFFSFDDAGVLGSQVDLPGPTLGNPSCVAL